MRPPRQRYEMRRIEAAREAKALASGGSQQPLSAKEILTARGEGRLIYYLSEGADRLDRALMELDGAEDEVADRIMDVFAAVRKIIEDLEAPPKPEPEPEPAVVSRSSSAKKRVARSKPARKRHKEYPSALICPDGTEIKVNNWVETRMALVQQIQKRKPGNWDIWASLPHVRKHADLTAAQTRSGSRSIGGDLHILIVQPAQKHRSKMREELKAFGLQTEKWGLRMPSGIENL